MRKSQITALIHDLVNRGLVVRTEADNDRRFNALSLTSAGMQAWRLARKRIMKHSDQLMAGLAPAEREELARLLRKLIATNLQELDLELDFD
jgi:DNA-binding MarR family transcriptional regulator